MTIRTTSAMRSGGGGGGGCNGDGGVGWRAFTLSVFWIGHAIGRSLGIGAVTAPGGTG